MTIAGALARTSRGIHAALRSRPGVAAAASAAVFVFSLAVPVAVLSLVRKPVDFFTFNPWLRRLPAYLASPEPLAAKLAFLSQLDLAWASADGAADGILEWGFIVDVPTLARIACTSILFGTYFALWSYRRRSAEAGGAGAGVLGVASSVFGLTTCPCALAGCGAPVLPVLGLAFTGASTATLTMFAMISKAGVAVLLLALAAAVAWLGWRVGGDVVSARLPGKVACDHLR